MKKRIQLDALEIQSFVTTTLTNEQTRELNGGGYTYLEPGSGACIECIVTDPFFSGDCGCDSSPLYCGGYNPSSPFAGCIP
jgi:hypothetical protein